MKAPAKEQEEVAIFNPNLFNTGEDWLTGSQTPCNGEKDVPEKPQRRRYKKRRLPPVMVERPQILYKP